MRNENTAKLEKLIISDYANTAGIVVLKNGETMLESYFNQCNASSTVHIYSVTKSIVSILIGIAIDKGYIKSIDQKVWDFFPDYTISSDADDIKNITLRHLMTMTAPYKYETEPYIEYFTSDNWLKFALDSLGGRKKAGEFRYAGLIGPDILSGIIVRATGRSLLDWAKEYLFIPLNISVEDNVTFSSAEEQFAFNEAKNISGWVSDPQGINTAGWGLTLSPMDMAKIGQLYLDGGMWKGRKIVSSQWVDESTREHSRWEQLQLAYGYLWWIIDDRDRIYAAMGDGGNAIYVNTAKRMVVSVASLYMPEARDRIELISKYIEPLFEN